MTEVGVTVIVGVLESFGFPIAMALILGWILLKQLNRVQDESKEREGFYRDHQKEMSNKMGEISTEMGKISNTLSQHGDVMKGFERRLENVEKHIERGED